MNAEPLLPATVNGADETSMKEPRSGKPDGSAEAILGKQPVEIAIAAAITKYILLFWEEEVFVDEISDGPAHVATADMHSPTRPPKTRN